MEGNKFTTNGEKEIACTICTLIYGLKSEHTFRNEEELAEHLEDRHGIPVMREGETQNQAIERCKKKGVEPNVDKCVKIATLKWK